MVRTGEEAQDLWCGSIYELKMGLKDFLLFIIIIIIINKVLIKVTLNKVIAEALYIVMCG